MRELYDLSADNIFQRTADNGDFVAGQVIVKRQGDSAFADSFGDWKISLFIPVLPGHKRLEVHRREIVAYLDISFSHLLQYPVALLPGEIIREPDHENKPAHIAIRRFDGNDDSFVIRQPLRCGTS